MNVLNVKMKNENKIQWISSSNHLIIFSLSYHSSFGEACVQKKRKGEKKKKHKPVAKI